jgi:hypothetical protein
MSRRKRKKNSSAQHQLLPVNIPTLSDSGKPYREAIIAAGRQVELSITADPALPASSSALLIEHGLYACLSVPQRKERQVYRSAIGQSCPAQPVQAALKRAAPSLQRLAAHVAPELTAVPWWDEGSTDPSDPTGAKCSRRPDTDPDAAKISVKLPCEVTAISHLHCLSFSLVPDNPLGCGRCDGQCHAWMLADTIGRKALLRKWKAAMTKQERVWTSLGSDSSLTPVDS